MMEKHALYLLEYENIEGMKFLNTNQIFSFIIIINKSYIYTKNINENNLKYHIIIIFYNNFFVFLTYSLGSLESMCLFM